MFTLTDLFVENDTEYKRIRRSSVSAYIFCQKRFPVLDKNINLYYNNIIEIIVSKGAIFRIY